MPTMVEMRVSQSEGDYLPEMVPVTTPLATKTVTEAEADD